MSGAAFRIFFDNQPATRAQLRRVEDVVVEQEIDMAWEGRVRMSMCLGDDGRWVDPPDTLTQPFGRMRIEIKLGSGDFVPLIDGTVAELETSVSADPGTSTVSLTIRDDSALMNRDEEIEVFRDLDHASIARQIFARFTTVQTTQIGTRGETEAATVRRGTPIQFLREMARVHNFKAYVVPGEAPGTSKGVFDALRTAPTDLPPLTLIGPKRSLRNATFRNDATAPSRVQGRSLGLGDQQVADVENGFRDEALMGALPALSDDPGALRQLPPQNNTANAPDAAIAGQTNRDAYGMTMTGAVQPGCYDTVLRPYEVVQVRAGTLGESGAWLLHKVTHHFNRSVYTQDIEAKRNARSAAVGAANTGGIF